MVELSVRRLEQENVAGAVELEEEGMRMLLDCISWNEMLGGASSTNEEGSVSRMRWR